MDEWTIGLDSWIIQDGNYGDCERGQLVDFAVEFWSEETLSPGTGADRLAERISDDRYRIKGGVVFSSLEPLVSAWVIDFGISVFTTGERPFGASVGTVLSGEIVLGIDPFDYFEGLHAVEGMPALIYSWRVDRIERQTAPFVEVAPRVFERDRAAWAWTDVDRTDAWNDDDGHAEYLLHCTLLDDLPRRKRTR